MPKFLNTIYQTTQSAPATLAAGGSLYASGSGIFFKNSTGTEYNLTSSKGYVILREYTSSGTWTKPSNAKYIKMAAVGAGGGGGGGARNTSGLWGGGGAGGAGAAASIVFYTGSLLPGGTYTVTVSAGTNGGLGRTTSAGFGGAGAIGGTTTLISASVTYIAAAGGVGGGGGPIATNASAIGGATPLTNEPFRRGPFRITAQCGGSNQSGNARNPTYAQNISVTDYHARNGFACCGGGGAGGTVTTAAVNNGASGSGIYLINGTLYTSGAPGRGGVSTNSGDNGVNNLVSLISLLSFSGSATITSSYGFGTAGHGGGSGDLAGTIAGGNGGNASGFGCGASGGGGAINQNGGNGGSGSGGYLAILEFY